MGRDLVPDMRDLQSLIDDLPELLREIAAATDYRTAAAVAGHFGGREIYLPEKLREDHPLARALGWEKACAVANAIKTGNGCRVLIPMGPYASRVTRWRRVKAMIDEKRPRTQIASACGVHIRTVQRHRTGAAPTVKATLRQRDLFD